MPRRPVEEITVSALNKAVDQIVKGKASPRLIRVGGVSGLGLNVRLRSYASGEAISASWVLRRTHKGQRRDFALGAWPDVGMGQARERARITLDQLWQGIEPAAQRSAKAEARTFRQAAERYFEDAVQGRSISETRRSGSVILSGSSTQSLATRRLTRSHGHRSSGS